MVETIEAVKDARSIEIKKPSKSIRPRTRKPSLPIIANRTMDLKMLNGMDGASFVKSFLDFKARFMEANKGAAYHIDGTDNPARRYWEYWWAIKYARIRESLMVDILEAGCGAAIFQFFLLDKFKNAALWSIDDGSQSPNFEDYCNRVVVPLGLKDRYDCSRVDITAMGKIASNMFNHIFCISVIEHIPDDELAFSELCRVLAPKGTLVLTFDFHKDEFPNRKDRLYTLKDIDRIINKGKECGVSLMYNQKFIDLTDWSDPPVQLGSPVDYNYNFGALFFTKK